MANLTYEDKIYLEKYLQMEGGYVLDFSNNSLRQFVNDNVRLDIYDNKYDKYGGSKARRIRAIWDVESDYLIGKLLKSFISYYKAKQIVNTYNFNASKDLEQSCEKIVERLLREEVSSHTDLITPLYDESDFSKLATNIKEHIEKNEPELALDRLHTFYVKFIRGLCTRHQIVYTNSESLNAIFGKYIKHLESLNIIESDMTIAILKYSINLLEKYNDVRNNKSFAHDNKLLNYKESLYIFDTLARLKGFIDSIEDKIKLKQKQEEKEARAKASNWDLPF